MSPDKIFVQVNGRRRSLAWLIENIAAATDVRILNNPGLTELPALPAATDVWIENNPGLTGISCAGKDSRNYQFCAVRIFGAWRIVAGCRNFSPADALTHWGPGGRSDRADCLALVNTLIQRIADVEEGGGQ